jgi:aspartate kinase
MVVGEGMRETVGTCFHVVGVLAKAGVNIEMINQGSSEISMMFGIRDTFLNEAVRALYQEFFAQRK